MRLKFFRVRQRLRRTELTGKRRCARNLSGRLGPCRPSTPSADGLQDGPGSVPLCAMTVPQVVAVWIGGRCRSGTADRLCVQNLHLPVLGCKPR